MQGAARQCPRWRLGVRADSLRVRRARLALGLVWLSGSYAPGPARNAGGPRNRQHLRCPFQFSFYGRVVPMSAPPLTVVRIHS